jgi:hypothetical protein
MIRKFAQVPASRVVQAAVLIAILAGAAIVESQETPAQPPASQQPEQQQPEKSGNQEATPEETAKPAKKGPAFKKWNFNVGGGANLPDGTTQKFVRSGGGVGAAGVARNYSAYFGFRLDFQFDNLPLSSNALQAAQAPGANSHVYSLMLDPIFNIPITKEWSAYVVVGPSFYHRSGKLYSSTAIPGAGCNSFFLWWGSCVDSSLPLSGDFLKTSQNEIGENFGAGVARKITPKMEVYADLRVLHGAHNGTTTDLRPITIGVRW